MRKKRRTRPLAERFWEKVNKDGPTARPELGPCWVWTSTQDGHGYGAFYRGTGPRGAHRVSWELYHGEPAGALCVLHKCDTPLCVRPEHLFLGTRTDNMADKVAKGRQSRLKMQRARLRSDNKTGYKGIKQRGRRWIAQIQPPGGTNQYIGSFADAASAARAYDQAARLYHGPDAYQNFPESQAA